MSTNQIIYICTSLPIIALLVGLGSLIKQEKWKNRYLMFWAFSCFFVHISSMYSSFFENKTGIGNAYDNILFPIYFCNLVMYTLLLCACWSNKHSRFFRNMATFTAWGGIFGALITVFTTDPGFGAWRPFKSALSHSLLLGGSLYLFVGGYAKVNVFNVIPYSFGILSCGVVGGIVELVYFLAGMPPRNAMYLIHGPAEAPFMHGGYFALAMLAIIFIFSVIFEAIQKRKDPSKMWYKNIDDINLYLPIRK